MNETTTEITIAEPKQIYSFGGMPATVEQAIALSKKIADSGFVPQAYAGKPNDVFIALQLGAEIGLKPMQAVQAIAAINGSPTVWGDSALALVKTHPEFVNIVETLDEETMTAICTITRKNQTPHTSKFSQQDASCAGLWGKVSRTGKPSPWKLFPKRMLQIRARGFCMRDTFPDALKGIKMAEEERDFESISSDKNKSRHALEAGETSYPSKSDRMAAELSELPQKGAHSDWKETRLVSDLDWNKPNTGRDEIHADLKAQSDRFMTENVSADGVKDVQLSQKVEIPAREVEGTMTIMDGGSPALSDNELPADKESDTLADKFLKRKIWLQNQLDLWIPLSPAMKPVIVSWGWDNYASNKAKNEIFDLIIIVRDIGNENKV